VCCSRADGSRRSSVVHRHAFASGFPCPEPLIPPTPIGRYVATAERYDPAGHELPSSAERVWRFAGLLVRLVRTMSPVVDLPTLDPPPDWAAWNLRGPGRWPRAAEGHVDLNAHQDPAWLANVVSRVRSRLAASTLPPVVGHVDWESKHLLWTGGAIHTVHDWDCMCALPEAGVAGLASRSQNIVSRLCGYTPLRTGLSLLCLPSTSRGFSSKYTSILARSRRLRKQSQKSGAS
jgi:hypothetical protein